MEQIYNCEKLETEQACIKTPFKEIFETFLAKSLLSKLIKNPCTNMGVITAIVHTLSFQK